MSIQQRHSGLLGDTVSEDEPGEKLADDDAAVSGHPRRRDRERERPSGLRGALREGAIVIVSALVLSILIKTFLAQAFYIPSGSMRDTLTNGDRVLVNKLAPGPFEVNRGDVVVFVDPGGWLGDPPPDERNAFQRGLQGVLTFIGLMPENAGEHLIKRVIAVGGDTVACCDDQGRLTVNGVGIDETYLRPGVVPSEIEFERTIPEGHVWLMGDNRPHSQDSRAQIGRPGGGAVSIDQIEGTAFVLMWPIERWSWLRQPSEVFADVPDP